MGQVKSTLHKIDSSTKGRKAALLKNKPNAPQKAIVVTVDKSLNERAANSPVSDKTAFLIKVFENTAISH